MITMRNWYVFVPENEMHIGYTGENQVFQLEIQTDSPPDWEYKLDLRYRSGQRNFLLLNYAENVLSCTLLREHLENGRVKAQIRAVRGEKEKHSNMFDLVVDGSILASKAFEKLPPSAFAQLENRLAALHLDTEAAAGAAQESVEKAQIAANTAAAAASTAEQAASASANAAASAQGSKTQAAQEVTKAALEVQKALAEAERAAGQAASAEQSAEEAAASANYAQAVEKRAEELTAKMPVVRDDKWWVYDSDKDMYIDSGQPSRGEKGEKGNVMFAEFALSPETGLLRIRTPEGYQGPNFRLNHGYLEVSVNG